MNASFVYGQNKKAGDEIRTDQTKLKVITVPTNKIDQFRENSDFNYQLSKEKGQGFWDLFWHYVRKFFIKLFSSEGVAPYIRYVLIFLFLSFVVYKIAGGNLSGIFSFNKKAKAANGFNYFEEDIYQQDIDKKLNEALRNRNFRDAIRYYYLILLKKLDSGEFILWELGKTNHDYQKELQNQSFLGDFIKLSGVYEYAWYGNFEVKEEKFTRWQNGFKEIYKKLGEK